MKSKYIRACIDNTLSFFAWANSNYVGALSVFSFTPYWVSGFGVQGSGLRKLKRPKAPTKSVPFFALLLNVKGGVGHTGRSQKGLAYLRLGAPR